MNYLEEAAEEIRKAVETNERENACYKKTLNEHRLEYAKAFAVLAALEKGLLPSQVADAVRDQFGDGILR